MNQVSRKQLLIFNGRNKQIKNLTKGREYVPFYGDSKYAWVRDDNGRKRPFCWENFDPHQIWVVNGIEKPNGPPAEPDPVESDHWNKLISNSIQQVDELAPAEDEASPFSIRSRRTWPRWMQMAISAPGLVLILFVVVTIIVLFQA